MTTTRDFPLGTILSVTTGRFVARDGFAAVHEFLDYMTGDQLFTHQIPRVMDECQPSLLAQHPHLAGIEVPDDFTCGEDVWAWLAPLEDTYGAALPVAPMPAEDHARVDPLAELQMMDVCPERTIVVGVDEEGR